MVVLYLLVLWVSSICTWVLDEVANKVDKQGECNERGGKTKGQDNPALLYESIVRTACVVALKMGSTAAYTMD